MSVFNFLSNLRVKFHNLFDYKKVFEFDENAPRILTPDIATWLVKDVNAPSWVHNEDGSPIDRSKIGMTFFVEGIVASNKLAYLDYEARCKKLREDGFVEKLEEKMWTACKFDWKDSMWFGGHDINAWADAVRAKISRNAMATKIQTEIILGKINPSDVDLFDDDEFPDFDDIKSFERSFGIATRLIESGSDFVPTFVREDQGETVLFVRGFFKRRPNVPTTVPAACLILDR